MQPATKQLHIALQQAYKLAAEHYCSNPNVKTEDLISLCDAYAQAIAQSQRTTDLPDDEYYIKHADLYNALKSLSAKTSTVRSKHLRSALVTVAEDEDYDFACDLIALAIANILHNN